MQMKTSFRLTQSARDAMDSLRSGLRVPVGRVIELALTHLESEWRTGGLKNPKIPKEPGQICCILMTSEGIAMLDRIAPAMRLSRTKVVELALRLAGEELRAGRIRGIGLLVS